MVARSHDSWFISINSVSRVYVKIKSSSPMSARKNRAPTSSIFAERFSRESITNLLPYSTSSTTRMPSHSVRLRITRTINRSWKFAERPPVPAAWRSRCPFCRKSPSVEIFDVGQIPLQRDERLSLDRFFFIDNSVTGRLSNIIFYRQQIDREKLLAQGTGDSRINQSQILRMSIIIWNAGVKIRDFFAYFSNLRTLKTVKTSEEYLTVGFFIVLL